MAEYKYRTTTVTTYDYGVYEVTVATLAVVPDGSHWRDRPATISVRVPPGTRPGGEWRVVIEPKAALKAKDADNG